MTDQNLAERLAFMRITDADRAVLREIAPVVIEKLPGILGQFYEHLARWPQMSRMFSGNRADMAKSAQVRHWTTILTAEFSGDYVTSVRRIGETHARIGLEPRWYIAGYNFIITEVCAVIARANTPGLFDKEDKLAKQKAATDAFMKAALLDMDFAISIYLEAGETAKKQALEGFATSLERGVASIIETVASAATELENTARSMSRTAERTSDRALSMSASAEEATTNVAVVASSSEQMGKSVYEIAGQVAQATKVASEAVGTAQATNQTIQSLSRAAGKIGEVVSMISDIAAQTNLLALNATIESARAGEAGRGFAVVAAEVKSLANQTAKATEDIATQISEMQHITEQSVQAIALIQRTIDEICSVSMAINAAVEEQSAATQEIARNTHEAAVGTRQVAQQITDVREGASETGAAASQVVSASEELGRQAVRLKSEVDTFLHSVRAA